MKKSLKFFSTDSALRFIVKRMDTNGIIFEVKRGMTYHQAKSYADHKESLGHKQTYWVEEDKNTTDPPKENSVQKKF